MAWKFWEAVPPSQVLWVYDTWVTQWVYNAGFMDSVEEGSGKTLCGVLVVHPHLHSFVSSECLVFQTIMLCLQPSHRNCLRVKLERVPGVSLPLGMLPKSSVKALLLVDQNTGIIAPSMWTCSQRIQMAPNWNQFREGLIIFQWCENVVPKNIENSVGVLGK